MSYEKYNEGYENQTLDQNNNEDDLPPAYPENPKEFEGYRSIGFCPPEPIFQNYQPDLNQQRPNFLSVPPVTEDEARNALAQYVSEHCCYGKDPVQNLTFTALSPSSTYQYKLETFTEARTTKWVYEPWINQPVVNSFMAPPHPWQIPVNPTEMFKNQKVKLEIPNTSHVEGCTRCFSTGHTRCTSCNGAGRKICISCNGQGFKIELDRRQHCTHCNGSGYEKCFSCSGRGSNQCFNCRGTGRLRWYIQLIVEFKNNSDDFFKKSENIPDKLLRECIAKNTFSEQNMRVIPVTNHPVPEINKVSADLVQQHSNKFNQLRILSQRHEVNVIPVTFVNYIYKEKPYNYIIFGLDNKVYSEKYPKNCCFCCSIL